MRIDYSEPKKSFVTTPTGNRPRKEPVARLTVIIVVTGLATFAAGFGSGWFLSQRAAKKSYQAAMEQTSLESAPRQDAAAKPAAPQPAAPTPTQPPQPGATPPPNGQTMPEPPLSFYKTLPSGQKSNVMGSGINAKEEKGKQPLQAAMPANVAKQPQQDGSDAAKPVSEKAPAAEKPRRDAGGFTVQVASYSLKSEAEAMRSKLAGKGYNVFLVESNQGDKGTWYRVRVGRKLEQDAAKELSSKIGKGAIAIPDKD
ncbi:SPOR domain-containing protein [Geobacter sp. FeAm09]|uniref:SPOR domain-containing protein n=1 Tax=Geobacter sp. FeAm09 TaxID=2597769 RepID=UPI0011EBCAD2|nr:SPOR domain-containing protein [Geobacter sp. FeAm09]QEM67711.1 SPOR domain-containing protein [Geobacter sp. FeAm09]